MDKERARVIFSTTYEELKADFVNEVNALSVNESAVSWLSKMCDYNVVGGKMNRGLCVVETALIMKNNSLSPEELKPFIALGWCIEWLQASFLIADDIMDSSLTRRGQDCWYRKPEVGMVAINDCFMLHSMLFRTLRRYYVGTLAYMQLVDLFIDTKMRTELGQLLDLLTAPVNQTSSQLGAFNLDLYRKIVRFKTAYYSFYLPVVSSLIALGYHHQDIPISELEDILIDLGELFQVQDDFLDCYGDPEAIGKVGTDIIEGKCTWLIVKCLSSNKLTDNHRTLLQDCYGKKSSQSEQIIKDIYNQLDLSAEFKQYELEAETSLRQRISKLSLTHPDLSRVLESFGCRIFGRRK